MVDRFTRQIKPGGWLYIGHSKSLIGAHAGLQLVGRTVYGGMREHGSRDAASDRRDPRGRGRCPAAAGRRFFDATADAWMVKVFPGEFYVSGKADEVLITVLGSCVSACIRDPLHRHRRDEPLHAAARAFRKWGSVPEPTRFGNLPWRSCLNELIRAGASRERIEIKVFGGGNVTDSTQAIGTENAEFVLRYLEDEGLRWAAQDLGGDHPRRIHYYPENRSRHPPAAGRSEFDTIARD